MCNKVEEKASRRTLLLDDVDVHPECRYIVGRFYHIYCFYIEHIARIDINIDHTIQICLCVYSTD